MRDTALSDQAPSLCLPMKDRQISSEITVAVARWRLRTLPLLLCALPLQLSATTLETGGTRVFPLSWFEAAQPRTALDLVTRLPGFALDDGDDGVRGYAGSAGNVLIDGKRPVSKYGQLANALKRIPADAVEQVELIRGSAPGIDMQGQPVVANVIRRADASTSIRALVAARLYGEGELRPEARLEGLRSTPDYVLEGTLHAYVLRSAMGHARITVGDLGAASGSPAPPCRSPARSHNSS